MEIQYLGHSSFLIGDLLIDPFSEGELFFKDEQEDAKCKIICISHDTHLEEVFELARINDAVIVAVEQIAKIALTNGLKSEEMNIGGWIRIRNWKIKMVEAVHSSGTGHSVGFILEDMDSNTKIYHSGNTGLFGDMKLIGEEDIDIAMLPIGDRYTMGIKDALRAVDFIKPKVVVPMHYNTFPAIGADPEGFAKMCHAKVEIFNIGEIKNYSVGKKSFVPFTGKDNLA